ncbi:MAG: hypothetical protein Unbinned4409contig1002_52 [Prokaryotic dsDNA virus sp.]|nr:MAG: hypothetical protein Unbinned4409contig1002_52 [Prokaryotic dsDNA virus sp.]|tara:strand:+ start:2113 stop:2838 length:726 start_codon:yes stop_codon:yes gene_type:complete
MRTYRVNGEEHKVFEDLNELPSDIKVVPWKTSDVGDWVEADDGCIIQILRKGKMLRRKGKERVVYYLGTCTGTFVASDNKKMDTSKRENIYSFSGFKSEPRTLTKKEELFVYYLSVEKLSPRDAYLKAFPTNNGKYALEKSLELVKTERVLTAVKEELKPVLEELGISEEYILKGIKTTAELAEKEDVKLRALFKLADILDLEDKQSTKVTQLTGVSFGGFDDKMLEVAERPKELIENEKE